MISNSRILLILAAAYLLCGLLISSCRERELSIVSQYDGDKLILWSNLEAGKPLTAIVRKSFDPIGPVPTNLGVSTANVTIYCDGNYYTTMRASKDTPGQYISDSIVRSGKTYVIMAEQEGLASIKSDPIKIPSESPVVRITRERNVSTLLGTNIPQDLISVYFERSVVSTSYISMSFLSYFEKDTLASNSPVSDNQLANEEDCHTWARDESSPFFQQFLFSTQCLPASTTPVQFLVVSGNYSRTPGPNGDHEKARKIEMKIGTIDKILFDFRKLEATQPEGLDNLVLLPQPSLTNITGGYGLIFGSITKVIEIQ